MKLSHGCPFQKLKDFNVSMVFTILNFNFICFKFENVI